MHFEFVAILLSHGADAHQPCPLRQNMTAFGGNYSIHHHSQERDKFYLMATLLNRDNNDISPEPPMSYQNGHLYGSDPNARLQKVSTEGNESNTDDTQLTLAVSLYLPYTIRYLVERSGADIHLLNALGLRPIDIAMHLRERNAEDTRLKQKMVQYLQQADRTLALMMSHQPRLGQALPLQPLFRETMRHILDHANLL
jgi:hypothetical protein